MVLAFDAFNETIKAAEESKKEREEIKAQLKILQANTSNLFKVLMGQEKENELKLYVWDEKKGGPIAAAEGLE